MDRPSRERERAERLPDTPTRRPLTLAPSDIEEPTMRLAFYTYSYTDRLDMPVVATLERIEQAGYDGIDVSGTHGNSADPKSFTPERRKLTRETCRRLSLSVEAVITHAELTTSLFSDAPLDLKGTVDLAVDVGAPVVTFHMGGPADDKEKRQEAWRRVVEYLKDALEYAAAKRVYLASDGIWPTWIVDTPESFLQLVDEVGSPYLGVNFDPCYLTLMGLDPVAVARTWRAAIVHAHLKDHVGMYPKWEHRIPGQGEMDYDRVVRGLKEIDFKRAISIETFTNMELGEACDVSYRTLATAMRAAGVRQ
jgi:sugar phosphate isomerase/epimerase